MGTRAAVAGASGYVGGELLRILLDHPRVELGPITADSNAGSPVTSLHPHLIRLNERSFDETDPELLADADLVFLSLPHGESAELAAELPAGTPVLDLGADHRLADPDVAERFYGTRLADPWTYGLPELPGGREALTTATRVAGPGCYAAAVSLAFVPMLAAGLVQPDDLVAVAASGTTGAGRSPKPNLMGSEVMGSVAPYKVAGAHQHIPEMEQALAAAAQAPVALSFTPVLAPMPRGILATCTGRLAPGVGEAQLQQAYAGAYGREPFVHVLGRGAWPRSADTVGSNAAHVQVAVDAHAGRAVAVAALDNLGKGAAGQAVHNANLLLGLDETTGLSVEGMAP